MSDGPGVAAGSLTAWLVELRRGQHDERGADVPCGECTACCTSSQFIHIGPDEVETLARIPRALLFPAPGLPAGNVLLGYDEEGRCPMFVDGRCSIYGNRPRTCRTYDCRVFPATGVDVDGKDQALIHERARRWRFDVGTAADERLQAALRAAATFLRDHARSWPEGLVPRNPTQLAFLAIQVHDVFLAATAVPGDERVVHPPADVVEAAVRRARAGGPR